MRNIVYIYFFFMSTLLFAQDLTKETYVQKYYKIALEEMHMFGIPASITLAQGILESGIGASELSLKSNNHFGIKCHKNWNGKKVYHDDDQAQECFRKYKKVSDSYRDHSEFLKSRERYSFLFDLKISDYKSWALGLKRAGYATLPNYADKLIKLIEELNLSDFDNASKSGKRKLKKPPRKVRKKIFKSNNGLKYILANQNDTYDQIATNQSMWMWQLLDFNDRDLDVDLNSGERVYLEKKKRWSKVQKHVAQKGESLYGISQLYGIQLRVLRYRNRCIVPCEIREGVEIFLRKRKPKN
ncbi:MAG: N-acetylmuramoyl-L-alanine amidase [Flavobacteriales bacterium]|nr:N-acetylmuramoyl-L-alanine amidase [Flavobacteriales bacterium]